MCKKTRSGSGKNIPDHISESLETIFWVRILEFFDVDADPGSGSLFDHGSGMEKIRIRDKHPGSAILIEGMSFSVELSSLGTYSKKI
jgi:hypothetical protein